MALKAIDGIPVMDAKHPLSLHITKRDCDRADVKHPESCAAAQAIRRELKPIDCRVHLGRVYIRQNKGNWQRYRTPPNLRSEIIAFDRGGSFEPGEYKLAPISQKVRKAQREYWKDKKKPKGKFPNKGKRSSPTVVKNVRTGPA